MRKRSWTAVAVGPDLGGAIPQRLGGEQGHGLGQVRAVVLELAGEGDEDLPVGGFQLQLGRELRQLPGRRGQAPSRAGHLLDAPLALQVDVHRLGQPAALEQREARHQLPDPLAVHRVAGGDGGFGDLGLVAERGGLGAGESERHAAQEFPASPGQKVTRKRSRPTTASRVPSTPPGFAMYWRSGVTASQGHTLQR